MEKVPSSSFQSPVSILGKRSLGAEEARKGETPAKRPMAGSPERSRVTQDTKGAPDAPVLRGIGLPPDGRLVTESVPSDKLTGSLVSLSKDVEQVKDGRYGNKSGELVKALGTADISNIIAGYSTAPQDRYGQYLDTKAPSTELNVNVAQAWALHDEIADRLVAKDPQSRDVLIHGVPVQLSELEHSTARGDTLVFKARKNSAGALEKWGARPTTAPANTKGSDKWAFGCSLADLARTLKSDHPLCKRYRPLERFIRGSTKTTIALLSCLQGNTLDLRKTPFLFSQVVPDGKSQVQPLVSGSGWRIEPQYSFIRPPPQRPVTVLWSLDSYAKDIGGPGIQNLYVPADLPFYGPQDKCDVRQFLLDLIRDLTSLGQLKHLSVEIPPGLCKIDLTCCASLKSLKLHTGAACIQSHQLVVKLPSHMHLQFGAIDVQASLAHKVLFEQLGKTYTATLYKLDKLRVIPDAETRTTSWTRPLLAFEIVAHIAVTIQGRPGAFEVDEAMRDPQGGIHMKLRPLSQPKTDSFALRLSDQDLAGGAVRRAADPIVPQPLLLKPKGRISPMRCDFAQEGHVYEMTIAGAGTRQVVLTHLSVIPEFDHGTMTISPSRPTDIVQTRISLTQGWRGDAMNLEFTGTIAQLKTQTQQLTYVCATPPEWPPDSPEPPDSPDMPDTP